MSAVDSRVAATIVQIGLLRDVAVRVVAYYDGVRAGVERCGAQYVEPWGVSDLRRAVDSLDVEALRSLRIWEGK